MNAVDASCPQCGHTYRWLCGSPLQCPQCHFVLQPQPITWGQYLHETATRAQRQEAELGDSASKPEKVEELEEQPAY